MCFEASNNSCYNKHGFYLHLGYSCVQPSLRAGSSRLFLSFFFSLRRACSRASATIIYTIYRCSVWCSSLRDCIQQRKPILRFVLRHWRRCKILVLGCFAAEPQNTIRIIFFFYQVYESVLLSSYLGNSQLNSKIKRCFSTARWRRLLVVALSKAYENRSEVTLEGIKNRKPNYKMLIVNTGKICVNKQFLIFKFPDHETKELFVLLSWPETVTRSMTDFIWWLINDPGNLDQFGSLKLKRYRLGILKSGFQFPYLS